MNIFYSFLQDSEGNDSGPFGTPKTDPKSTTKRPTSVGGTYFKSSKVPDSDGTTLLRVGSTLPSPVSVSSDWSRIEEVSKVGSVFSVRTSLDPTEVGVGGRLTSGVSAGTCS